MQYTGLAIWILFTGTKHHTRHKHQLLINCFHVKYLIPHSG